VRWLTWQETSGRPYLSRGGGLLRLRGGMHEETKLRLKGFGLVPGAQAKNRANLISTSSHFRLGR